MLIFEINNCGHEIKITLQKIKTKSWIKFLTIKKLKRKQIIIKTIRIKSNIKTNEKQ
jgi:hypothetical protein